MGDGGISRHARIPYDFSISYTLTELKLVLHIRHTHTLSHTFYSINSTQVVAPRTSYTSNSYDYVSLFFNFFFFFEEYNTIGRFHPLGDFNERNDQQSPVCQFWFYLVNDFFSEDYVDVELYR